MTFFYFWSSEASEYLQFLEDPQSQQMTDLFL